MALGTFGSAGFWAVVVVLPAVEEEFGVDRADASLPYALTMIGFGLGNAAVGRCADRFGIVGPLVATSLLLGAGFAAAALSGSVWTFALVQGVLIGVGCAGTFGPLLADVSHWFRARRGIAVALAACGNYLGGAAWPLAIQLGLEFGDWRDVYLGIGAACVLAMTPLALLLRGRPPRAAAGAAADAGPRRIALSQRALLALLALAGVGCCVAMSMPQVHVVAYCGDLGHGAAAGAEMLSLMLAGGAASRILFGFLADRLGGVRTLLAGSAMQCAALFLYLPFDGLASLYVVSLVFGLSQGGIVPSYAIIVREYMPARAAGARIGLLIMATILGMALGGMAAGWIHDLAGSYRAAFLHGIAWNFLNIGVMVLLLSRTRGRLAPA